MKEEDYFILITYHARGRVNMQKSNNYKQRKYSCRRSSRQHYIGK